MYIDVPSGVDVKTLGRVGSAINMINIRTNVVV